MAAGRPVVSTSLGCEGLGLDPGRHLLVRDEPRGFADALVSLLGDKEGRARLAREGRERAERDFDWRLLGARLEEVLEDAAASRARTAAPLIAR
jgi:glycosyltransferase involved in cell wall biosynthesis